MINVLHLINYLGSGGSEIYIYNLAKKLHNDSCKFYIAYSEIGKGLELFNEIGVETINFPMNSPFDIKAALKLKRLCKELNIQIIHTHFLRENYISILSKLLGNKVRLINTRHMIFQNSKFTIIANKIFTRFNDYLIAVSSSVKDQMINIEGLQRNKIKLIYTGVDIDEWSNINVSTFKDKFNLSEYSILITTIARFSEEKGYDFLLDSIAKFKEYLEETNKKLDYKFILVGEGELLEIAIKKAKEYNIFENILFTGYRRDIKNILKSSDIFILPSKNEAFGISILEAMAAGVPVITTDSGGTREIINSTFDNGIIIQYGDINGLIRSIISLIDNSTMGEKYINNSYKVLNEHFNLNNTINETYKLYKGRDNNDW